MAKRQSKLQPARNTLDDAWMQHTYEVAAKAMAHWMKSHVRLDKPVNKLQRVEMEHMVESAISAWIVEASKRAADKSLDDGDSLKFLFV